MFLNSASLAVLCMMADAAGAGGGEPSTDVATLADQLPVLKPFDPKLPAEFGNSFLAALVATEAFDAEIQAAQAKAEDVRKHIGFELAKAIMHASEDTAGDAKKEINVYAIFEGKTPTEKLFSRLMQHFGIVKKEIVDEELVTTWTSKAMAEAYDYTAIDKEKDEAEWNRRSNNRKRLNMRFTDACKMAIALMDNGVKGEQLVLQENAETKAIEPVIKNAPDFLRGDKEKNGSTVSFGRRNANEGAKIAPNVASLVKAATEAHRSADETGTGQRSDTGNERSGDAKLGMTDEDFGAIVNNLRRAITAQEGQLSDEMVKQLNNLVPFIAENIEANQKARQERAADEQAGVDMSEDGDNADNEHDDGTGDETTEVSETAPAEAASTNKKK